MANLRDHADELRGVELVIADPPYGKEDFKKYGVRPFFKPGILKDIHDWTGARFLAWLDTSVPMYSRKQWTLLGHVGMVISTNNRMRVLSLWSRSEKKREG